MDVLYITFEFKLMIMNEEFMILLTSNWLKNFKRCRLITNHHNTYSYTPTYVCIPHRHRYLFQCERGRQYTKTRGQGPIATIFVCLEPRKSPLENPY